MNTPYTAQRHQLADNVGYGPVHESSDGDTTLCGQEINHYWYLGKKSINNAINCKKCLKLLLKDKP